MTERNQSLPLPNQLLLAVVALTTMYFLSIAALPKLIVTEQNYTDYYWFRAPWLFVHVVAGLIATLIGWYQFIPSFRNRYLRVHRVVGRVYLACIAVAALTAAYLAYLSPGMDTVGKISFMVIPFVWIGTISLGFAAIRRRRIDQHLEWMLRSYVVTCFFTIFVILTKYLPYEAMGTTYETSVVGITWFSWAVPVFVTEMVLQGRKIFAAKP
jgi:uncharacterized membrane protein